MDSDGPNAPMEFLKQSSVKAHFNLKLLMAQTYVGHFKMCAMSWLQAA